MTGVVSPYARGGADQVSADGTIAFAEVNFDQQGFDVPTPAAKKVISVAQDASSSQLQVALGGQAIEQAEQPALGTATGIGLVAAIVILLITFGSVVAMGLPIATALLGLGTGVGLISIGTHVIEMPDFSTEVAVMIGLGVGIDYALFVVTRFRENYRAGGDVEASIVAAMDTAGRAVVFAGTTVIIALLGMFALGMSFLNGMAVAASLGVLMTLFASLTALPALLSRFGHRVGRAGRRERRRIAAEDAGPAGFLAARARVVQAVPARGHRRGGDPGGAGGTVFSMRLASSDAGNNPTQTPLARHTTCSRRGSARASTAHSRSSRSCPGPPTRPGSRRSLRRFAGIPTWRRWTRPRSAPPAGPRCSARSRARRRRIRRPRIW